MNKLPMSFINSICELVASKATLLVPLQNLMALTSANESTYEAWLGQLPNTMSNSGALEQEKIFKVVGEVLAAALEAAVQKLKPNLVESGYESIANVLQIFASLQNNALPEMWQVSLTEFPQSSKTNCWQSKATSSQLLGRGPNSCHSQVLKGQMWLSSSVAVSIPFQMFSSKPYVSWRPCWNRRRS